MIRRAAGAVVLAGALAFTASFVLVLVTALRDERRDADAIVVLGAAQYNGRPSPVLRARLEHALGLWREGYAPRIILTGGTARGDNEAEATVGRRYLIRRGVPDSVVDAEPVGHTTMGSMSAVQRRLRGSGARVILVSDPFHMLRLSLEARRIELEAYLSPTPSSPISDNPVVELRYLAAEAFKVPVVWVRSWEWFRRRNADATGMPLPAASGA